MSTILKALKRLDEQRRADAAPKTLEEQVLSSGSGSPADPDARRGKRRLAALGVGGALTAAAVAWALQRDAMPAPPPPPVAAAAPRAELADVILNAPRGALPTRGDPVSGTELDSAVRAGLRAQPSRGDVALAAGPVGALPAAGHQPEPGVGVEPELLAQDAARARVAAAAPPAAAPDALPRFRVASARQPEPAHLDDVPERAESLAPAAHSEVEPPLQSAALSDPAPMQRAEPAIARPEVWVERTQWHPMPEKRSALVRVGESGDARELHEGDAVSGVVVKEIRPSGVLFLHDGADFKRGVGER